jgi:hypothetical protein
MLVPALPSHYQAPPRRTQPAGEAQQPRRLRTRLPAGTDTQMKQRQSELGTGAILFAALALLLFGSGCHGPERVVRNLNDVVAEAYDTISDARDRGLVTQAEIDQHKPVYDAIDSALDAAGAAVRAGDDKGYRAAVDAAYASLSKLQPLLEKSRK